MSSVENGRYIPADVFEDYRGDIHGIPLALEQRGNREEFRQWHLHQDLAIALELLREGDVWLAMNEGYIEVARLRRSPEGDPISFEIRAEHLKDYLAAREMALYVATYRQRVVVVDALEAVPWRDEPAKETKGMDRWEGRAWDIHEGGTPFGAGTAVFHVARTDVDPGEDVPTFGIPGLGNTESESWTFTESGPKLVRVEGELWRCEWVEPSTQSVRVRQDKLPSRSSFRVDSSGALANADDLRRGGRWLWFRPDLIMTLAHRRGGALHWYTRDTGSVRCSPDYDTHFGLNNYGFVTVYAKDIALLPDWQQRIWAGFNVTPEGGVSEELLASQVRAEPAATQAPEEFLPKAFETLNSLTERQLGFRLFQQHEQAADVISRVHRLRAVEPGGLYALAKDVARLTADSINTEALHRIVPPPKGEKWGSLKSLERVLATKVGNELARRLLGPLVGAYELRHADAHLPSSEAADSLKLVSVDPNATPVSQGYQLLDACVSALFGIAEVFKTWDQLPKE